MSEKFTTISDYGFVNPSKWIPESITTNDLVSFIPMQDVSENGDWYSRQMRPLSEVQDGFTCFKNKDVLIAKITPCFENGKGALVDDLAGGVGFGSTEFHVLRAKKDTDPRFLFHLSQWKHFRVSALQFMSGSAGQQRVASEFFYKYKVEKFTKKEQGFISDILSSSDRQIHETEVIIAKLKQLKQGLLFDLLTRGVDKNGELRPTYEQAPDLYKPSELGWIPTDWVVKTLKEISTVRSGSTPLRARAEHYYCSEGGYPWVKTMDLNENSIVTTDERITSKALQETSCSLFPENSVLIAMYGGWEQIGRAALIKEPSATNQAISALIFDDSNLQPEFVLRAIQFNRFRWKRVAASTRKDPNITKSDVEAFSIALPLDSFEQKEIVNIYHEIFTKIKEEQSHLMKLKSSKSGLMDDLLTRKKRISDLIK